MRGWNSRSSGLEPEMMTARPRSPEQIIQRRSPYNHDGVVKIWVLGCRECRTHICLFLAKWKQMLWSERPVSCVTVQLSLTLEFVLYLFYKS